MLMMVAWDKVHTLPQFSSVPTQAPENDVHWIICFLHHQMGPEKLRWCNSGPYLI
jgi:hypothetical protein